MCDSTVNQKKSDVKPVPKQAPKISVQVKRQLSVWTRPIEVRTRPKMRARSLRVNTQPEEEWFDFVAVPEPAKPLRKVEITLAKRSPKSPVQVKRERVITSRPVDVKTGGKVMETLTKQAPSRSKPIQTKITKLVDFSTTVRSMRQIGQPAVRHLPNSPVQKKKQNSVGARPAVVRKLKKVMETTKVQIIAVPTPVSSLCQHQ